MPSRQPAGSAPPPDTTSSSHRSPAAWSRPSSTWPRPGAARACSTWRLGPATWPGARRTSSASMCRTRCSRSRGVAYLRPASSGDIEELSFADASFDAVVGNFAILHVGRPEQVAAEAVRVLAHGGRLAFTAGPARACADLGRVRRRRCVGRGRPAGGHSRGPELLPVLGRRRVRSAAPGSEHRAGRRADAGVRRRGPSRMRCGRDCSAGLCDARASSSASRRMTRPASATRSRAASYRTDEALELPVSVKLAHGRRA